MRFGRREEYLGGIRRRRKRLEEETHPPHNFLRSNGKYEEVLEEGRDPRVPWSKGPKVHGSQGPKDQEISKSHSNTSLTLKKVHLVTDHYCSSFLSINT